jgi:hypothetical protein
LKSRPASFRRFIGLHQALDPSRRQIRVEIGARHFSGVGRDPILEAEEEFGPLMNADQRGLKTKILAALVGVHQRLKTFSSQLLKFKVRSSEMARLFPGGRSVAAT